MFAGTRYRICRELGRGSSSIVYEAEHVELGRRVALKVLDAERTHSRDFTVRFRREARALSRLHHPNLVRVYDFGQSADGRMYSAMELVEGDTLRAILERGDLLGYRRVMRIGMQAARALNAARDAMAHKFFNTSRETETCAICMEPCDVFYRGSIVKCPHVFHPVCLRQWLSRTPTCPICRKSVCRLCKDAWKCLLCRMDSSLRHLIPSWVEEEAAEVPHQPAGSEGSFPRPSRLRRHASKSCP
jgi:hypothetical protein